MLPVSEVAGYLKDFYPGRFGELAAKAFTANPDKYKTKLLADEGISGVLSYEIIDFDSINIKLLAGDLRTIKQLISPIRKCNLSIMVPESLGDYLSDLESVGFRVDAGKSLLYLTRSGDING